MKSKTRGLFLTLLLVLTMVVPSLPVKAEEPSSETSEPETTETASPQNTAEPTETPAVPQASAAPAEAPKAPVVRRIISPVDRYSRRKYEFYTDNTFKTLISSQTVKNGDSLKEPDHPENTGKEFQYWQTESGTKLNFNSGHVLAVSGIDDSKKSVDTVRVYPVYAQKYTVTFHDMNGSVITIRNASEGGSISTSDVKFEVLNGYYVSGWTTSADGSETGSVGDTVQANSDAGFVNGNLNLYPIMKDVCWVIFDDGLGTSSTEKTYTAPVRVRQNKPVSEPAKPTRNGYEFVGWSTKKNGTKDDIYDFTQPVTASMVLYAIWSPVKDGTSFTVQVMAEKLVNGKHVDGSYEPVGQYIPTTTAADDESQKTKKIKATAEDVVNPSDGQDGIKLNEDDITKWLDEKSNLSNSYAYDFEKMDQNVTVNGDGTTIVYVYYKLHVFTVKFTIADHTTHANNGGAIWSFDKNSRAFYYDANDVSSSASISYQFNGKVYRLSDDGDDTCYQFSARLGENITDVYPGPNDINITIDLKDSTEESDFINTLKEFRPYAWYQTTDNKANARYNRPYHATRMNTDLIDKTYSRSNPKDDYTLYYEWQIGGVHKICYDMLENVNDDKFSLGGTTESSTAATGFAPSEIRGYTWVYSTEDEETNSAPDGYPKTDTSKDPKVFYFYYYRNRYILDFWNNGMLVKAYDSDDKTSPLSRIKHGTALSKYYFVPERPDNLDDSYQFEGWYTTSDFEDGTKVDFSKATMPIGNMKLYAHWTVPDVHVTYNLNGGHSSQADKVTAKYGNTVSQPADPQRDGYSFVTWVDEETSQPYSFTTKLFADKTLVARWIDGRKIRLVYDAGEGTNAPTDRERYADVSKAVIKSAPKAPAGKYFYGWKYNGKVYQTGSIIDVLSEFAEKESDDSYRITLTAVYGNKPAKPVVIYDMNDGSGKQYQTDPVENNSVVRVLRLSDVKFSRKGYVFVGWNTKADGSGKMYQPGDQILVDNNGSNVLYAQWEKSTAVKKTAAKKGTPDTSDTFNASVWEGLLCIAVITLIGVIAYRRKQDTEME